jgi:hypothetical protein
MSKQKQEAPKQEQPPVAAPEQKQEAPKVSPKQALQNVETCLRDLLKPGILADKPVRQKVGKALLDLQLLK